MIRTASAGDVDTLVQFVHDLAEFEGSPDAVEIDRDLLDAALFGPEPTAFAHVAEEHGAILGVAIWYPTFSTWTGRSGIHLEDLYVRPEARGNGVGRSLVVELAMHAHRSGYGRVEWSVLDWNETALRLYRSIGAVPLDEWTTYRLSGSALWQLAAGA